MLNIDTNQRNKNIFNPEPSGNRFGIWDLTESSIRIDSGFRFSGLHTIKSDEVMRPDLISHRKFGAQGKCGTLMKVSGISNPFAIDQGDVLFIPEESSIELAFEKRKEISFATPGESNSNQRFRKSQQSKKFSVSKGREEYLNLAKSNIRNRTTGTLPPNVLDVGERGTVTRSGLIFLGPDTTSPNG